MMVERSHHHDSLHLTSTRIFSMLQSRRQFIRTTGTVALMATTGLDARSASAKDDQSPYTIGLSQYSLRALIRDKSLDPLDYPAFTLDNFGINHIDLWEGGLNGKQGDLQYLEQLRGRSEKVGTEIFLLMTGALDANPSKREQSLKTILPSIERAQVLGAEFLRVFLKAPGKDAAAGVAPCVEALKTLADAAEKKGVMIAIEPGASELSSKGAFLSNVMRELKHENCRLMPDFGKQKNNVYDGTEAMMPYTVTISAKMHSFDEDGNQPHFDYERLMKIIAAAKYRGIISIEWEGNNLQPIEGVKASKKLLEKSIAVLSQ